MDMGNPVEAVIPGAQGKVLRALLGSGREMSTSEVARVADISQPHASRVLGRLVELGIVQRRHVPPAVIHELVIGNAVVTMLESLRSLRFATIQRLRASAQAQRPRPVAAILFGSLARGTASADSDIDLLLVRPTAVDHDQWSADIATWTDEIARFAGNPVSVIDIDELEWSRRRGEVDGLFASVRDDGIDLLGPAAGEAP